VGSRLLRQRVWFCRRLLCATVLLYLSNVFWRTAWQIFDSALATAPAPSDVVIVAIDDASIAELGLGLVSCRACGTLDRLRADGARAVALDILFTEPDPNSPKAMLRLHVQ